MAHFPYHRALIVGAGSGISVSLAQETGAAAFALDASRPDTVAQLSLDMERQVAEPDNLIDNASSRVPGPLSSVDPTAV